MTVMLPAPPKLKRASGERRDALAARQAAELLEPLLRYEVPLDVFAPVDPATHPVAWSEGHLKRGARNAAGTALGYLDLNDRSRYGVLHPGPEGHLTHGPAYDPARAQPFDGPGGGFAKGKEGYLPADFAFLDCDGKGTCNRLWGWLEQAGLFGFIHQSKTGARRGNDRRWHAQVLLVGMLDSPEARAAVAGLLAAASGLEADPATLTPSQRRTLGMRSGPEGAVPFFLQIKGGLALDVPKLLALLEAQGWKPELSTGLDLGGVRVPLALAGRERARQLDATVRAVAATDPGPGKRHELRPVWAAVLLQAGKLHPADVVSVLARAYGDPHDAQAATNTTLDRLRRADAARGLPTLLEAVGPAHLWNLALALVEDTGRPLRAVLQLVDEWELPGVGPTARAAWDGRRWAHENGREELGATLLSIAHCGSMTSRALLESDDGTEERESRVCCKGRSHLMCALKRLHRESHLAREMWRTEGVERVAVLELGPFTGEEAQREWEALCLQARQKLTNGELARPEAGMLCAERVDPLQPERRFLVIASRWEGLFRVAEERGLTARWLAADVAIDKIQAACLSVSVALHHRLRTEDYEGFALLHESWHGRHRVHRTKHPSTLPWPAADERLEAGLDLAEDAARTLEHEAVHTISGRVLARGLSQPVAIKLASDLLLQHGLASPAAAQRALEEAQVADPVGLRERLLPTRRPRARSSIPS